MPALHTGRRAAPPTRPPGPPDSSGFKAAPGGPDPSEVRLTDPFESHATVHLHEIEDVGHKRVAYRRGRRLTVRTYVEGRVVDEERRELADAIEADAELRRLHTEWEGGGWVLGGETVGGLEGDELDSPSARQLGEHLFDHDELQDVRRQAAGVATTRRRRNARYETLHRAIDEGRGDDALALLAKRVPRSPHDSWYEPALELAVLRGLVPVVDRLTERREDLELAVVTAAAHGPFELLRHLIEERGADPKEPRNGSMTPLLAATIEGRGDVVAYLLEAGADPDATYLDLDAFEWARDRGHDALAARLTEHVDRSPERLTERLCSVVRLGHPEQVARLAAAGARVDGTDADGVTPLILAITREWGRPDLVEALLAAGADPSHEDERGWSPWLMNQACLAKGIDPDSQGRIRDLLEQAGASREGAEAIELYEAAGNGSDERVAQLLDAGVHPDGGPASDSPLIAAAARGHARIVRRLLEHGAEVDRRRPGRFTALIKAAYAGHLDVVETLVAAGASLEAEVGGRGNAADYAARGGHREVVGWLEQHGSREQRLVGAHCLRRSRDRLGWRLFRRHTDVGNGEYSILLVEAPAEPVAAEIARRLEGALHVDSVHREPGSVRRRAQLVWVVQLVSQPWTIVVHGIGSLTWGLFDEGHELATGLAGRGWRVVHATENHVDCEERFVLFAGGQVAPHRGPRLLRELGIALPGFDPWHEAGLRVLGIEGSELERVDVIDVPWPPG